MAKSATIGVLFELGQNFVMTKSWKHELRDLIIDVTELWQLLELPEQALAAAKEAAKAFPLRVTKSFLNRMQKGNVNDPLLKQCLPWHLELNAQPKGYQKDALKEQEASKIPGLLHKYHGRVLLVTTGACAINCRYCFRRHFPYDEHQLGGDNLTRIVDYIGNNKEIFEIILSGGDPLMLTDAALEKIMTALESISHVKTLRIHSRLPVVLPSRITPEFLEMMQKKRLQKVMVIHSNHPQELNNEVSVALNSLRIHQWYLLNQAVLLKGVNDNVPDLVKLQHKLFEFGVLPYYLHLLDQVNATAHFEVTLEEAQSLVWQMMQQLPGYLVPKLATEIPGLGCKWIYGAKK